MHAAVYELATILADQEEYQKANLYFKQLDTLSPDLKVRIWLCLSLQRSIDG